MHPPLDDLPDRLFRVDQGSDVPDGGVRIVYGAFYRVEIGP